MDYLIEGCDQQWARGDGGGDVTPRAGTLTWVAGDSTPKTVKLQIDSDDQASLEAETCNGTIRLYNPSNSDAFLFQQVVGIRFFYLDDELPDGGRIWRVQNLEFREEGEAAATLTMLRRGNVTQKMSTVVWPDPYPSVRWGGSNWGLGYREGAPENWRSGVAGNDYIDEGKQVITWGPGEVQTKSLKLKLVNNTLDDNDKLITWNFLPHQQHVFGGPEAYVYVSDSEDRFWAALDSDADGFANGVDFDMDGDGTYNWLDGDVDGDGVSNSSDAFRNDPTKSYDMDFDGIADSDDPDVDGDGIPNESDPFPDRNQDVDYDGDGLPNNQDLDTITIRFWIFLTFSLDESETIDTDGDGIGENTDDNDADGIPNVFDAYPNVAIADFPDIDGDGAPGLCDEACLNTGMSQDRDDDGDGWPDALEIEYGADPSSKDVGLTFAEGQTSMVKMPAIYQVWLQRMQTGLSSQLAPQATISWHKMRARFGIRLQKLGSAWRQFLWPGCWCRFW